MSERQNYMEKITNILELIDESIWEKSNVIQNMEIISMISGLENTDILEFFLDTRDYSQFGNIIKSTLRFEVEIDKKVLSFLFNYTNETSALTNIGINYDSFFHNKEEFCKQTNELRQYLEDKMRLYLTTVCKGNYQFINLDEIKIK